MRNERSSGAAWFVGVVGLAISATACGGPGGNRVGGGPADDGTKSEVREAGAPDADAVTVADASAPTVGCMGVMEFINVFPRKGSAGSTVVLVGLGLSPDMSLAFPGGHVAPMDLADPDMNVAFFTVPDGAIDGELAVECGNASASLGGSWTLSTDALPVASSIAPSQVKLGGVITLSGTGLSASSLQLNSASTPIVNTGTDTSARFVLPSGSPRILTTTYRPILRGSYGAYLLPASFAIEVVER